MTDITQNLDAVRLRIGQAAHAAGRDAGEVTLLAVSKTKPVADIRAAQAAGQRDFGENYLQDALPKIDALIDQDIRWHFIGPIQSNKTRAIAEKFDWVHSVDRLKIAERLNQQRPSRLGPLNICLQVNISNESAKAGVSPDELPALIAAVAPLAQLRLRGLMAIPRATSDPAEQRQAFLALRQLLVDCADSCPSLDTLSMGMSADLEAAIAAGATLVRVGTDIFGARAQKPD